AKHPSARRLANLPPGSEEQRDGGEHPDEEHGREVEVGRGDARARAEGVRGHPVDDQVRRGNQVDPAEGGRVEDGKGPRPPKPLTRRATSGNTAPGVKTNWREVPSVIPTQSQSSRAPRGAGSSRGHARPRAFSRLRCTAGPRCSCPHRPPAGAGG